MSKKAAAKIAAGLNELVAPAKSPTPAKQARVKTTVSVVEAATLKGTPPIIKRAPKVKTPPGKTPTPPAPKTPNKKTKAAMVETKKIMADPKGMRFTDAGDMFAALEKPAVQKTPRVRTKKISDSVVVEKLPEIHPGLFLLDEMLNCNLSVQNMAKLLGVKSSVVSQFVNAHTNVTTELAVRLSFVFETSVQHWMNLKSIYDVAVFLNTRGGDIAKQVTAYKAG